MTRPPPLLREVSRIIVHHSASSRLHTTLEEIARWHTTPAPKGRGFRAIGYHFVIESEGKVRVGRPLPEVGAHALHSNHDSVGICVVGNNVGPAVDHWTDAQVDSLRSLIAALRVVFPSVQQVLGHREVRETECPGLDIGALLAL